MFCHALASQKDYNIYERIEIVARPVRLTAQNGFFFVFFFNAATASAYPRNLHPTKVHVVSIIYTYTILSLCFDFEKKTHIFPT